MGNVCLYVWDWAPTLSPDTVTHLREGSTTSNLSSRGLWLHSCIAVIRCKIVKVPSEHFLMITSKQDKNKSGSWEMTRQAQYLHKWQWFSGAQWPNFQERETPTAICSPHLLSSSHGKTSGAYTNQRQSYSRCHPEQRQGKSKIKQATSASSKV